METRETKPGHEIRTTNWNTEYWNFERERRRNHPTYGSENAYDIWTIGDQGENQWEKNHPQQLYLFE